jgi:hypothetical protein
LAAGDATTILAKIMMRVDAKSEANHHNIAQQAAIGTKEGTTVGISMHVGTNVLHEADALVWGDPIWLGL